MWSTPVDLYCERTDPSFWAEPFNAWSNVAFLIAAALAWRDWRRRRGEVPALLLIFVTALVGFGSFAFHTLATRGAVLLDVIPIALFIHGYLYLALRRYLGVSIVISLAITLAFFGATQGLVAMLPRGLLNSSVGYLPALAAMLVVGWIVPHASTRRMLLGAAAVFAVSLTFRTADLWMCPVVPLGTHAVWHVLNAVVLFLLLRALIAAGRRSVPKLPSGSGEPRGLPIH